MDVESTSSGINHTTLSRVTVSCVGGSRHGCVTCGSCAAAGRRSPVRGGQNRSRSTGGGGVAAITIRRKGHLCDGGEDNACTLAVQASLHVQNATGPSYRLDFYHYSYGIRSSWKELKTCRFWRLSPPFTFGWVRW